MLSKEKFISLSYLFREFTSKNMHRHESDIPDE
jgi:hypothetical protein